MQVISQRYDPADYYEERRELTVQEQKEAELGQLRDEASLARRKAVAIVSLLDGLPLSQLTVPTERMLIEWHVASLFDEAKRAENRIAELETTRGTRKDQLREEWKSLQQAWMLAENGQDEITRRQSEIEAELTAIDSELEMAVAS